MNEINRKRIKRAAISWLCVAALAAAAVPAEMTGIITPMTVWAEDNSVSAVTAGTIDLGRLMEYKSDSSLCPAGVTAELVGNDSNEYNRYVVLTFSQSGTYKLVGRNYINGSYDDVQIKAADNADVTIVCDDVKIPLKMHIGGPDTPLVSVGQTVSRGQLIAQPNGMGANIHASIDGTVTQVTGEFIEIRK